MPDAAQAGAASHPGGRRSAGSGGAVDWGHKARTGSQEQRSGWRPRVRQNGDPGGRRELSLSPWGLAVRALRLQGPSLHRPVERRQGGSQSGVRARKTRRPPELGGHAWSRPGRGARAPRLAPAPGAEARAEEAGARRSSGLRLGGGAAGSAPLRRLESPARARASSRASSGSTSSSRGHRRCCARHRQPRPRAGSGHGRAGGPLGSAVYAAAAG